MAELRDKMDFEGEWPTPISVPCVALLFGDSALQKLQQMHTSELVQLENCTIQTTEDGKGFEPVQREDKCIEQARLDWITPKEFARRSAAVKWSDAVSVRARRLSDGSCVNAIALFSRDKRAKQHQADGKCNSKPQPLRPFEMWLEKGEIRSSAQQEEWRRTMAQKARVPAARALCGATSAGRRSRTRQTTRW
jgi:hypothetical protein